MGLQKVRCNCATKHSHIHFIEKCAFDLDWSTSSFLSKVLYSLGITFYFTSSVRLYIAAAAAAKSLQLCPTLCDPIDGSLPGSTVPGILWARTLEWVAISFSNAWKWKVKVKSLSRVGLLATSWTAAYQAPLSMGFFQARVLEWGAIAFSEMRSREQ